MKKRLASLVFIVLAGSTLLASMPVRAEGNSVTISPASVDLEFGQDDTQKVTTFTLANSYNVPVDISVELQGIDQQGGRIVPAPDADSSLSSVVRFSETLVTVPDKASKTITATFTNTDSLSPGGHYGTIVFAQKKVGDSEVNITQSVSVGLFLVKRGGHIRDVRVNSFRLSQLPYQIPGAAFAEFENVGNVHITPRASVLVYDARDNLVAKSIINEDSRRILPGKTYQSETKIVQSRRLWLPQKMTIVLEYRGDGVEEIKQLKLTKLYIPGYFMIIPFLLAAIIVPIVRGKFKRRHTNNRRLAVTESNETSIPVRRIKSSKSEPSKPQKIVVKTNESELEP
jgi:hypothetical protein